MEQKARNLQSFGDAESAHRELDRITKLLIRRDLLLSEANAELDSKVRSLEETQRELVRTSETINSLLANSPDAIWVLNSDDQAVIFNKSAEDITGYPADEVLGRRLDFLFTDPGVFAQYLRELQLDSSYRNLRLSIRRRDGRTAHLLLSLAKVRDFRRPDPAGTSIVVSKDLTREIQLEQALREAKEDLEEKIRQRTIDLENLSQRLAVLNQVATVASQFLELEPLLDNILQVVLELSGFPMGVIYTRSSDGSLTLRSSANVPPQMQERLARLGQGDHVVGRAAASGELQAAAPSLRDVIQGGIRLVVAVPLRAKGVIQGVMGLLTDRERALEGEESHLLLAIGVQAGWAIENARLFEQVREDVEKLKEVDRIKTEFIATISHELRTPLTSIVGFLHYAQADLAGRSEPGLQRYIQVALENSQKLSRMIEDLLAMQKLESGTMPFRPAPLSLRVLLERLAEDLGPQLAAREQVLEIAVPPALPDLWVDHEQFERVLVNLIINAIKFSQGPGTITISARRQGERFRIVVADTGIGMTPEVQARIFDGFFQAEDAPMQTAGGVGLGLTIAQRIIELHGGSLGVASEPNHGSRFTILLPDRPGSAAQAAEASHAD